MARKDGSTLKSRQKAAQEASWACVGIDSSMTAVSVVATGYDGTLRKPVGPSYGEMRWMPEDDYYMRLGQAAKSHDLVLDALKMLWVIDPAKVYIAMEEPFHYGAVQRVIGAWLKQQAEVSGAVKGSLVRYGFLNLYEINNSQWHAVLRKQGVVFEPPVKGGTPAEKAARALANKFVVKDWGIGTFGLPEFPDLVKSKEGGKIPRPESGYGAKAKPIQPSDIYDAAAVCAWMAAELEDGKV